MTLRPLFALPAKKLILIAASNCALIEYLPPILAENA
jgi:hypothetical protein